VLLDELGLDGSEGGSADVQDDFGPPDAPLLEAGEQLGREVQAGRGRCD
jgi:hypothetical protein